MVPEKMRKAALKLKLAHTVCANIATAPNLFHAAHNSTVECEIFKANFRPGCISRRPNPTYKKLPSEQWTLNLLLNSTLADFPVFVDAMLNKIHLPIHDDVGKFSGHFDVARRY